MCGIVGVVSSEGVTDWQKRAKWFAKALLVDVMRGEDSTGIVGVDKIDESIFTFKKAMPSYDFLQLNQTEWMLNNFDNFRYVIGHNRAATVGGVNHNNAHPFIRGPITLVHNGTLWSRHGISRDIVVDSDAIAEALSKVPPTEAKKVLEDLDGPFALAWHDARDNSFHLCRNKERPMHFALTENNKTFYYASEPWMVKSIHDTGVGKIWTLNPGWHLIFTGDMKDLSQYKEEQFTPLAWGEPSWKGGTAWKYEQEDRASGKKSPQSSTQSKSTGTTSMVSTDANNVHHLTGNNVGSNPKHESRREKKERLKQEKKDRRNDSMRAKLEQYGYGWREKVIFSINQFQKFAGKPSIGMAFGVVEEQESDVTFADQVTAYDIPCEMVEPYLETGRLKDILYVGEAIAASMTGNKLEVIVDSVEFFVPDAEGEQTDDMVMGPDGDYITEEEFDKLTAKGCAFCTDNIHFEDASVISWTEDRRPLCQDCQEYGDTMLAQSGVKTKKTVN